MNNVVLVFDVYVTVTVDLYARESELLVDDDEFGLEGAKPQSTQQQTPTTRKRYSDPDSDSKVQFTLEHGFGDSHFSPAGTFSARLKSWSHGGKTLTKLRFSRNGFSDEEKDTFKNLLTGDDFYRIRVPSSVISPPGKEFVVASVRAASLSLPFLRCLPRDGLDEHFVIHMEGANILAASYGSLGACQYPRQFKLPAKWSFNSHTILKCSEQAPRTPIFTEEILGGENADGEVEPPPERSFWAKYWMYLIPLGLVVMNAVTQATNMAEEQTGGQAGGSQVQQSARRR
ncbi:unnamed protein product [Brassica napus]|uniref:ER membrane protein complex subunit 10 n=1 Tax=Brassica napus TaxID=3708 RepID=A0A816JS39_BRANA|nr:unnamed protein product [Brassica napus]